MGTGGQIVELGVWTACLDSQQTGLGPNSPYITQGAASQSVQKVSLTSLQLSLSIITPKTASQSQDSQQRLGTFLGDFFGDSEGLGRREKSLGNSEDLLKSLRD